MRTIAATLLLTVAATVPIAHGQTGTEGSILGDVKDSSSAMLPGANITITNLDTGVSRSAITGPEGFFQVLALPRGVYSVSVSAPAFSTLTTTTVIASAFGIRFLGSLDFCIDNKFR